MQLDKIDKAIIGHLETEGRLSIAELGERVGLSASACSRRLQGLEQGGVIRGYRADIDPHAHGFAVTAFVYITLSGQGGSVLEAFETMVRTLAGITDCHLIAGEHDYLLRVRARDIEDFERIHRDQLSRLPHVARMVTSFALREVTVISRARKPERR